MTWTTDGAATQAGGTPASGASLQTYLVELYVPSSLAFSDVAAKARAAAEEVARAGGAMRYVGSVFVPGDELCFCLFRAEAAAAVARTVDGAGLSFERIVPSEEDRSLRAASAPTGDRKEHAT